MDALRQGVHVDGSLVSGVQVDIQGWIVVDHHDSSQRWIIVEEIELSNQVIPVACPKPTSLSLTKLSSRAKVSSNSRQKTVIGSSTF